jgi:hypothetical protein
MRWLRILPALLLGTAPLAAQGFQGVITMRMGEGNQVVNAKVHVAGGKTAVVVPMPGPGGTVEARMVIDPDAKRMTMLVPIPMGGAKGMKMTMELDDLQAQADGAGDATVRALGSKQTIAGMSCDDYAITSDGETVNTCLTTALGAFMIPAVGGRPGARPSMPEWAEGLEDRFPLKVWKPDGTVVLLVENVERGPVAASMFDVNPEGYQDMSGMMPGGRRN